MEKEEEEEEDGASGGGGGRSGDGQVGVHLVDLLLVVLPPRSRICIAAVNSPAFDWIPADE